MELLATLTVLLFLHGANGAQWSSGSPPDGLTMFVCSGDTVTFTWQYLLDAGDVVGDTEWLYDGHSQELVAITTHGLFLPTPAFSQRVQVVGNAGISLSNVIVGDSGNYSVEVNVYTNSGATRNVLRRTAVLDLSGADSLQTVDGSLHVRQNPEAVFDNATNQWAMQLQCGVFKFVSNPPVQVEWTGPSGQTYSSNDYSNGYFNLLITKPIPVGSFTCRLSARFAACLHGNAGHMDHAVLTVDSLEARMAIVEKENQQLRQCSSTCSSGTGATTGQDVRVDQLQAQLQHTESTLSALNRTMTQENQQLGTQLQHMTQENQQLRTQLISMTSNLTQENQQLKSQLQATESTLSTLNITTTQEISQLKTQLQHAESTLSSLNSRTSALTQDNQNLNARLQGTESTISSLNSTMTLENQQLKTQLQHTESTLSALNSQISTLTQDNQHINHRLQESESTLSSLNSKTSALTQDNQNLNARLQGTESTLSALNSTITQENQQLRTQLQHTESTLSALTSTMTQEYQQLETELQRTESTVNTHTQELATLNTKLSQLQSTNAQTSPTATTSDLSQRLAKLEDTARYRVAFHANYLLSDTPPYDTPLIFNNVHYNQGGAYNSATGNFVVPADGVYFFISSTGPINADTYTWHYLYVDKTEIDYSYSYTAKQSYPEMSSVHGVMHLRAGQRVWIRSGGDHYWGDGSSFTGFLLSRDF